MYDAEIDQIRFLKGDSKKRKQLPQDRFPEGGSKKSPVVVDDNDAGGGGQADVPEQEADFMDHYEVLGLSFDASPSADDIKKAYRELALQYHPDKTGNDEALAQKFKEINEANEILTDEKVRKIFDAVCQENKGRKKRRTKETALARREPDADYTMSVQKFQNELAHMREKKGSSVSSPRPCVLLVDEVDVFFGDGFYGQPYQPSVDIDTDSKDGYKLLCHIWQNRGDYRKKGKRVFEDEMMGRPEVGQLQKVFTNLKGNILERCAGMMFDIMLSVGR